MKAIKKLTSIERTIAIVKTGSKNGRCSTWKFVRSSYVVAQHFTNEVQISSLVSYKEGGFVILPKRNRTKESFAM